jgi:hypothetical protein
VHQMSENEGLYNDLDAQTGELMFSQPRAIN